MTRSLPTAKPMRQPGIEKVFDIEVNSTVTSISPFTSSTDGGEAFLGAERRDDLGLGIELHPEAAAVIRSLRLAQAWDAARGGIAVGARLAGDLLEFLQYMSRRR